MAENLKSHGSGASSNGVDSLAIETSGLTKSFSGRNVVSDVSLRVPRGSVFGFLGPNGSGKTTTIRMALGLVAPNSGSVSVLGRPVEAGTQLSKVGVLVEGPGFYPYLSGYDNLKRFAKVAKSTQDRLVEGRGESVDRIILSALERVDLTEARNKKFRAYSLGMKQRLAIAAALMWPRELLVLDEPTNGLDPQGIVEVRELLTALNKEGITIFVSSHILSEIEMICSDIAIMKDGELKFQGSIESFKSSLVKEFLLTSNQIEIAKSVILESGFIEDNTIFLTGNQLRARLVNDDVEDLVRFLVEKGVGIRSVGMVEPSLEDAFVALTGRNSNVH